MIDETLSGWTDRDLFEYWQERVAIRFGNGQQETIEQVQHMEAKALMQRLGGVLPKSIQQAARKFSGWTCRHHQHRSEASQ